MAKNKKKKYTNIMRDRLADYYLTNREITKHYDEEHAKAKAEAKVGGTKTPWKSSEKTMLLVTLVAAVLLFVKYVVLR